MAFLNVVEGLVDALFSVTAQKHEQKNKVVEAYNMEERAAHMKFKGGELPPDWEMRPLDLRILMKSDPELAERLLNQNRIDPSAAGSSFVLSKPIKVPFPKRKKVPPTAPRPKPAPRGNAHPGDPFYDIKESAKDLNPQPDALSDVEGMLE